MKIILLTLSLMFVTTARAEDQSCQKVVVIINPSKFEDMDQLEHAFDLLATPNLSVLHSKPYFGSGKMALIAIKNDEDQAVVDSLKEIPEVTVACKSHYEPKPRLTGGN